MRYSNDLLFILGQNFVLKFYNFIKMYNNINWNDMLYV